MYLANNENDDNYEENDMDYDAVEEEFKNRIDRFEMKTANSLNEEMNH